MATARERMGAADLRYDPSDSPDDPAEHYRRVTATARQQRGRPELQRRRR